MSPWFLARFCVLFLRFPRVPGSTGDGHVHQRNDASNEGQLVRTHLYLAVFELAMCSPVAMRSSDGIIGTH